MISRRQAKLQRLTAAAESSSPTPDPTPPAVTLVCLPDDALLAVLSHLPPRQLLVCRAVCRRLRALCLHRDLWRAVHVDGVDAGLLRTALHLAPCLRKISRWYASLPLAGLAAIVAETACVVTEVQLSVLNSSEHAAATDIILKLSALGGVRKLELRVSCQMDTACMLIKSIYSLHGLADLAVMNATGKPLPGGWCYPNETASLKRLHYSSSADSTADPFAKLLLLTHAATLEEVDLDSTEDIPTSLLAALPRLRSLTCCPSNDLSRLVELPNLSTLILRHANPSHNFPGLPVGTLDLLREARHLRRVHLFLPWEASATEPLVALRASRSAPALESLDVYGAAEPDTPDDWELVAIVPPRFPALKTLAMRCVPSDEFLRAVSPDSLPGLNKLLVNAPWDICFHAWVHDPAVQDVLARNPRLHLRIYYGSVPESCSCRWCRWGCHKLIRGDECCEFSFSAHSKVDDCPVNCYQVVGLQSRA